MSEELPRIYGCAVSIFHNNSKVTLENDCEVFEAREVDKLPVEDQIYLNLETS